MGKAVIHVSPPPDGETQPAASESREHVGVPSSARERPLMLAPESRGKGTVDVSLPMQELKARGNSTTQLEAAQAVPTPHGTQLQNPDLPERHDEEKGHEEGKQKKMALKEILAEAGRKVEKTILEPMGLWVDTRNLIDDDKLPNGFPRISAFIASDRDHVVSIYKRFDNLNNRNLLLLEAKLAALQALQKEQDKEDFKMIQGNSNFAMSKSPSSFEYFAFLGYGKDISEADLEHCDHNPRDPTWGTSGGIPPCAFSKWGNTWEKAANRFAENVFKKEMKAGKTKDQAEHSKENALKQHRRYWQDRWEVAQAIRYAIKEYQEAVVLQDKMLRLQTPTKSTMNALRKYINGLTRHDKEGNEIRVRPSQFDRNSAAKDLLTENENENEDEDDWISLHPPGDDDLGTWFAAKLFGWLLKRRGAKSDEFNDVSEIAVGRFTTLWTFFIAIGFLIGAIWVLWRVGLEEINVETKFVRKLASLTGFTTLFGIWVALFTSAKRYEIFGATAAYAAVLIVFVGVDPGDAIGP